MGSAVQDCGERQMMVHKLALGSRQDMWNGRPQCKVSIRYDVTGMPAGDSAVIDCEADGCTAQVHYADGEETHIGPFGSKELALDALQQLVDSRRA